MDILRQPDPYSRCSVANVVQHSCIYHPHCWLRCCTTRIPCLTNVSPFRLRLSEIKEPESCGLLADPDHQTDDEICCHFSDLDHVQNICSLQFCRSSRSKLSYADPISAGPYGTLQDLPLTYIRLQRGHH